MPCSNLEQGIKIYYTHFPYILYALPWQKFPLYGIIKPPAEVGIKTKYQVPRRLLLSPRRLKDSDILIYLLIQSKH